MKRDLRMTFLAVGIIVIVCAVIAAVRGIKPAAPHAALATARPSLAPPLFGAPATPSTPQPGCRDQPAFAAAAADNAGSLSTAEASAFGRPESGWEIYAPLIGQEVGAPCEPQSSAFAAGVAGWQSAHAQTADGRIRPDTLSSFAIAWLKRRPFVQAMRTGCPPGPDPATLQAAHPEEVYGRKPILARTGALSAYRAMVAAAAHDLRLRPPLLTLASGYRGPEEETQRCADGSCGTPSKARCSAHRTGLAFDLYLSAAPGLDPFSSDDINRRAQARTPAYKWLVAHAGQFGFVPYPFEPWHWEWTGEPV